MQEQTIEGFSLSPLQHHLVRVADRVHESDRVAIARVRVRGPLDPTRLGAALEEVAREHEILRTAFPKLPGTAVVVQSIRSSPALVFDVHSQCVEDDDALAAIEADLARRPFDLEGGEVLRAALVPVSETDHHLLLAQPTLAADATSLWNLVRSTAGALHDDDDGDDKGLDDGENGAMQFADVAQWLHDNLESEEAAPGLEHWHTEAAAREAFTLPLEFDRGEDPTRVPGLLARPWTPEETEALERVAASTGTSPAVVLAAAWCAFLARLTERNVIPAAFHSEGRSFEGLAEALGPFGRVLPIDVDVHGQVAFSSLVRTVHTALTRAQDWHEVFDPERSGVTHELPAHAVVFHEPVELLTADALEFELERRRCTSEPAHLALELDLGPTHPELALRFDRRHIDDASAAVLLDQVGALLADACARSETPVESLSLVPTAHREKILDVFSRGPESPPRDTPIPLVIAAQAARTPDAIAVQAGEEELTYAELDRRADRLARHLVELGVEPGAFVGLFIGRCVEQIVGILGVMKAGAAYLPLPPGYPRDRIAFMLEDTAATVVLTRRRERDQLPSFGGEVVELDADAAVAGDSAASGASAIGLDDPAYVIFTSGSTGRPKGVVISHANLAHSTLTRLDHYREPVGAYLLLSSFAFDSSVPGIFWTLAQGGRLVLPEDGFEQEIPSIAATIRSRGITHMLGLPSLYGLILDGAGPGDLDSLRAMIVAGESCPPELVRQHRELLPEVSLFNEYGPTEGTVWSSVFDASLPFERPSVPIGGPIPSARTIVVDAQGDVAPIGVAGELLIGGAGIATGYLNRPELTAERFVETPLAAGERFYRTGDLVRLLPDGNLEFLGRIDHQVKIRGYRIELEEIEAVLSEQDGVRECVVLAREDSPGDLRLVAYVLAHDETVTAAVLRDGLATPLPDYMIPSHFVFLADFPLLPNGKVDRRVLPAPGQDRTGASATYEEPATPVERVLAAIWSDVLQVERVGVNDDFFELGGHSILATKLFARMVDLLQTSISLRAIFDHRSPRALAAAILDQDGERERIERTAEVIVAVLDAPDDGDAG